jgi:CopA family copper-resistance protein
MQTMTPSAKLDDPGIGLRDNGRHVLTYADLVSTFDDPDGREPSRTIELHLTGHMERFAWSFDGIKFSGAEPLRLSYGERVRFVLVNDTMMTHPIHLHGMWSDLEDDEGRFLVRKHTIDMPPGTRRSYRVTADALGRWAYHCHLLFHMEAGMFREVRVEERSRPAVLPASSCSSCCSPCCWFPRLRCRRSRQDRRRSRRTTNHRGPIQRAAASSCRRSSPR